MPDSYKFSLGTKLWLMLTWWYFDDVMLNSSMILRMRSFHVLLAAIFAKKSSLFAIYLAHNSIAFIVDKQLTSPILSLFGGFHLGCQPLRAVM